MNNEKTRMILLDIEDEEEQKHVSKEDILMFFKSLKTMPAIDKEAVYQEILKDKIDLPQFEFEEYYLKFCHYKGATKDMVIIQDVGSDNYYYIQDEQVFKCSRYEAQEKFYGEIATKTNKQIDYVHDTLIDKLKCYEAVLLSPSSQYLSTLYDFIADNIYMFDAALKEKEIKSKSKVKLK